LFEPGPTSSASTGEASASSSAVVPAANTTGRRMIARDSRTQKFRSPSRRSLTARGTSRTRSSGLTR
jgi:hypothetical protein